MTLMADGSSSEALYNHLISKMQGLMHREVK